MHTSTPPTWTDAIPGLLLALLLLLCTAGVWTLAVKAVRTLLLARRFAYLPVQARVLQVRRTTTMTPPTVMWTPHGGTQVTSGTAVSSTYVTVEYVDVRGETRRAQYAAANARRTVAQGDQVTVYHDPGMPGVVLDHRTGPVATVVTVVLAALLGAVGLVAALGALVALVGALGEMRAG